MARGLCISIFTWYRGQRAEFTRRVNFYCFVEKKRRAWPWVRSVLLTLTKGEWWVREREREWHKNRHFRYAKWLGRWRECASFNARDIRKCKKLVFKFSHYWKLLDNLLSKEKERFENNHVFLFWYIFYTFLHCYSLNIITINISLLFSRIETLARWAPSLKWLVLHDCVSVSADKGEE